MKDIRWSYNPETKTLDVWDSEDGRIGHYERTGQEGFKTNVAGRISGTRGLIYGNRPFALDNKPIRDYNAEEVQAIFAEAKEAVEKETAVTSWLTIY
jgi:hypothetical protein